MASKYPSNASLKIDDMTVNVFSSTAGITSVQDGTSGMPVMGSMVPTLEFSADIHDQHAVPFATVKQLYELCYLPTKDKIKNIKIEFWTDENRNEAILSLSFKGWVSSWIVTSGGGGNHVLSISVQPTLSNNQYTEMTIGN
ncbi:hypothetical protein [Granulicella sp. S156]|uniref:hypothetical protein n=1 Tax=Granulicella sp. S156 TaxID=1747224 RepID=UPI00131B89FB|nr:hypothetical protein [Granulicella sp. S156]